MKELLKLDNMVLLAATISCIGDGMVSLDLDNQISYLNQAAEELTNCRLENVKLLPFDQVVLLYDPRTQKLLPNAIGQICRQIAERKKAISREFIVIDQNKHKKYISTTFSYVRSNTGESLGYAGVLKDISQIHKMEVAQTNERKNFQSIFNHAPEAMITIDEKECVTRVNDEFLRQLNKTKEEVVGLSYGHVIGCRVMQKEQVPCGESRFCIKCPLKIAVMEALATRKNAAHMNSSFVIRFDQKDQKRWFRVSVAPLIVNQRKHAVVIFTDTTESILRERSILEARDFCNNILNQLPSLAWMMDENFNCVYVNAVWTEFTGKSIEEMNEQGCIPIIHPDDLASYKRGRKIAFELREVYETELRLKRKDDVYRWCMSIETPYYTRDGKFSGYIGSFFDISEQVTLREESKKYHQMINHARDFIILTDLEGNILEANESAQEAYGYTEDELKQMNVSELYTGEEYTFAQLEQMKNAEGLYYATIHKRKDGSEFYVEVRLQRIMIGEQALLFSIARDITERKRSEEELVWHQSKYFYLLMNMNDFYAYYKIIYDNEHNAEDLILLELNKSYEDFLGFEKEELIGKLFSQLFPGEKEVLKSAIQKFDGQLIIGKSVTLDEIFSELYQRWLLVSLYSPSEGEVITIISDITEKKEHELQLIEMKDSAEAANRAKSEFLANMSHEIRTPLNGMVGMVDLTLLSELDEEQRDNLETAKSCANALLNIINDILDFSKMEAEKIIIENVSFDIRMLTDEILKLFRTRVEEKQLSLIFSIDSGIPDLLYGDPNRLRQVLNNLLSNAVKFTDHGEIQLSIRMNKTKMEKVMISFSVLDTGIGIKEEDLKLLFQRFMQIEPTFTKQYGGTGLGLVIAKRLVEMMGGTITVESTIGVGSRFTFQIPFSVVPTLYVPNEKKKEVQYFERKLKILLAEDDKLNRKVIVKMLEEYGHKVDVVKNGQEAVDSYEPGKYHIILMDIQMPKMDGMEATKRIRTMEPDGVHTPICALTAYALKGDREKFLSAGMDGYVAKPIDLNQLLHVIDQIVQTDSQSDRLTKPLAVLYSQTEDFQLISEEERNVIFEQIRLDAEVLKKGVDERKTEMIESIAHEIKEKASIIDRAYLKDLAFKIELAARRGNLDDAEKETECLRKEIKLLNDNLTREE